jgi:hypothetical protein
VHITGENICQQGTRFTNELMFTKDLIQAISDWQRGGDAKQKLRRGKAVKMQASRLPIKYKTVTGKCFRQIALKGKQLLHLGTHYQLSEAISSWTLSETVAREFKGGVPPPGDYQGIIFSTMPSSDSIILNIDSLFNDIDFVASIEQYKNEVDGYGQGIGRWGNSQHEVIIEVDRLPLEALQAWGGFSSTEQRLAKMFFGRTPNNEEMKLFNEVMSKAGLKTGAYWLSTPDAVVRASEKLKFLSRELTHVKNIQPATVPLNKEESRESGQ